jgi:RNA polymerase sigma-70 factor (ECF subfamily)
MTNRFRARADELGCTRPTSGFHGKTSAGEDPESARLVVQAVARAKEGDREALRFLYLRYADNVYGYVRSILRDEHEAEDVTQHVFAKLMTHIVKYDQRSVPFFAWLLRLSHNAAIDHLRARRATPTEEVRGSDETADESAVDRSHSVHEALAALPEEQRTVVGLHHRGRRALQAELAHRESAPSTAMCKVAA